MKYKMKNKNSRSDFKNYIFITKIVWQINPCRILLELFAELLSKGIGLFYSVVFLRFIFYAIESNMQFRNVMLFIIISSLGYCVVTFFLSWYYEHYRPITDVKIIEEATQNVFIKAGNIELSCYENTDFYNNYTKVINEVKENVLKTINELSGLVSTVIISITFMTLILSIDKITILFVFIPMLLTFILGKQINKLRYELYKDNLQDNRRKDYLKRMIYLNSASKDLRLYKIYNVLCDYFEKSVSKIISRLKKQGTKIGVLRSIYDNITINVVYYGSIMYVTIKILIFKSMLISDYFVLINAVIQLGQQVNQIFLRLIQIQNLSLHINDLVDFIKYEPKIPEDQGGISPSGEHFLLKLQNVSFRYKENQEYILENINMTIHQGDKVAIVGYNGAGKTTLIKLILRLYDCVEGNISVNQINIKDYDLKEYRKLFATVFQDFKLFAISIKENILLGDERENVDINNAIDKCGLQSQISALEDGIDSIVTKEFDKEGVVFSAGQEQRIAAARALIKMKDSKLIIVDEPTSALDPIAEQDLFKNIFTECRDKTVIYVSHRLSSAMLADKIYVLEQGRIIEEGNHTELMKSSTKYKEMFIKQRFSYADDTK